MVIVDFTHRDGVDEKEDPVVRCASPLRKAVLPNESTLVMLPLLPFGAVERASLSRSSTSILNVVS